MYNIEEIQSKEKEKNVKEFKSFVLDLALSSIKDPDWYRCTWLGLSKLPPLTTNETIEYLNSKIKDFEKKMNLNYHYKNGSHYFNITFK